MHSQNIKPTPNPPNAEQRPGKTPGRCFFILFLWLLPFFRCPDPAGSVPALLG
nr:MAG TPA: hypothetical protein [Caudoviricetes sp.]